MGRMNRRDFVLTSTALSASRVLGANDRIRVAGLGTGGRCRYLLGLAAKNADVEIVALCDVYEPRRIEAQATLAPAAKLYLDYREVLNRTDVDAVFIGSPDHWHVPMTIAAVRAGKDVYVEKPISHSIEEGDALLKAVAGVKQIVQTGTQQRSWPHFQKGKELIDSGALGRVTLVLASWYQDYRNLMPGQHIDPSKLDWKRFLGSAPEQPFDELRFRRWRWFWDFGGGALTDLYCHWVDVIHWYMGLDTPRAAQAMGGNYIIKALECPETINACYDYGGFESVYTGTMIAKLEGGELIFRGDKAMMKLNRDGLAIYPEGVVPAEKTHYPEPVAQLTSAGDGTPAHVRNFLDCVKSRQRPNAPVEVGVAAARASHIGNLALRRGSRVTWP
jgi:predicted dehydrogenase